MLDAHRRGQRERLHRHRLKPVLACGACQARLLAETDADRRALNQRMANLLDLLGDCARLYHRAPNCLKKLLNRVFFDAILVNPPDPDTTNTDKGHNAEGTPAADGRHPGDAATVSKTEKGNDPSDAGNTADTDGIHDTGGTDSTDNTDSGVAITGRADAVLVHARLTPPFAQLNAPARPHAPSKAEAQPTNRTNEQNNQETAPAAPATNEPWSLRDQGSHETIVAVAAGFEPAVAINHTAFRVLHLRPLGHATADYRSGITPYSATPQPVGRDTSPVCTPTTQRKPSSAHPKHGPIRRARQAVTRRRFFRPAAKIDRSVRPMGAGHVRKRPSTPHLPGQRRRAPLLPAASARRPTATSARRSANISSTRGNFVPTSSSTRTY